MKSKIIIKSNAIGQLHELINLAPYSKIAVLTDRTIAKLWLSKLTDNLKSKPVEIIIPSGEKQKNVTTLTSVWQQLKNHQLDRHSLLINLGGGVICDLGGFAASTYMRGIDFIHLPTTLLAQVDASIGGKTAINFNGLKNIIGTFTLPKAIIIDPQTLSSLSVNQITDGMAEVIKHGLIKDKKHFQLAVSKKPFQLSQKDLIQLIKQSSQIKLDIVSQDKKEANLRKILNFGHTIGHALESSSQNTKSPLPHGQAVSLGMVAEAKLSQLKGFLTNKELNLIEQGLKHVCLPIRTKTLPIKSILTLIKSDKKNQAQTINFTLLKSIGQSVINQIATIKQVETSLLWLKNSS